MSEAPFNIQPPYDRSAERSILGAMLADPELIPTVQNLVRPSDFYTEEHRLLYSILGDLYERYGTDWDEVVLQDVIRKRGHEEKLPFDWILGIYEEAAPISILETACQIVREKAKLRRLLKTALTTLRQIAEKRDPEKIAQYILDTTTDMEEPEDRFYTKKEIIKLAQDIIKEAKERPTLYPGYSSGFPSIDDAILGFRNGTFNIIAARPGRGKTTYLLTILKHFLESGLRVLFFSLEMGEKDIIAKFIPKIDPEVSFSEITKGQLPEEKEDRLYSKLLEFLRSDGELYLDTKPDHTIRSIKARSVFVKKRYGVDLILLDYIQLIRPYRNFNSPRDHISEVSSELKGLAKMLDVPIIAAAQLNRQAEKSEPTIGDLKESGQLEQDADVILLLHRDSNPPPERKDTLKVKLAKNRHVGTLGTFYLRYNPDTQLYEEVAFEYPVPTGSKNGRKEEEFDESELDF